MIVKMVDHFPLTYKRMRRNEEKLEGESKEWTLHIYHSKPDPADDPG